MGDSHSSVPARDGDLNKTRDSGAMSDVDSDDFDPDDMSADEFDGFLASAHAGFKGPHNKKSLPIGRKFICHPGRGLSNLSEKYSFPTLEAALAAAIKDPKCNGVTLDPVSRTWSMRGGNPHDKDGDDIEDYDPVNDLVDSTQQVTSWTKDPNFMNFEDKILRAEDCNFQGRTLFRPKFQGAELHNPSFKDCILVDADFSKAKIFGGDFENLQIVGDINFGVLINDATIFVTDGTTELETSGDGKPLLGILGLHLNKPNYTAASTGMNEWATSDQALEDYETKLDEIQREKQRRKRRQSFDSTAQSKTDIDIDIVDMSDRIRVVLTEEQSSQYQGKTLIAPIFNGVTFTNANFSDSTLIGAKFKDCTFAGTGDRCFADFTKTTFSGGVEFANVSFHAPSDYVHQQFGVNDFNTNEKTSSTDTTPSVGADFTGARFSGLADFRRCTFKHVATFAGASFAGGFTFAKAIFSGQHTSFEGATFYALHRFLKGTDNHEEHFLLTQFLSKGYSAEEDSDNLQEIEHGYKKAHYTGSTLVIFGTSFCRARFEFNTLGTMGFQGAEFKYFADFTSVKVCTMHGDAFLRTAFKGGVTFEGSVFGGNQEFRAQSTQAEALEDHKPRSTEDVEFSKGDILISIDPCWADWSDEYGATNPRNGSSGLYPDDKIKMVETNAGPHTVLHIDAKCVALFDDHTDDEDDEDTDDDPDEDEDEDESRTAAKFKKGDVLINVRESHESGIVLVTNESSGKTGTCSADKCFFKESSRACLITGFNECTFGGEITSFQDVTFNAIATTFKEASFGSKITTFKGCSFPVSDPDGVWTNKITVDTSDGKKLGVKLMKNPATGTGAAIKVIDAGGEVEASGKATLGQIITHVNDTDVTGLAMKDIALIIRQNPTTTFTLESLLRTQIAESFDSDDVLMSFDAESLKDNFLQMMDSQQEHPSDNYEDLALLKIARDVQNKFQAKFLKRTRVTFEQATFTGIDFVDFSSLDFGNAAVDFSRANFTNCSDVSFTKCNFEGNARFRETEFDIREIVNFDGVQFFGGFDFYKAKFTGGGTSSFEKTSFDCVEGSGHQLLARMVVTTKHCNFHEAVIGGRVIEPKKISTAQPKSRGGMVPFEKVGKWNISDVGSRVVVKDLGHGTLHFVGKSQSTGAEKPKPLLGVELDVKMGKHNGTWQKATYFKATAQHGVLKPLDCVTKIKGGAAAAAAVAATRKEELIVNHFCIASETADFRGCQWNKCRFFNVDLGTAQFGLSNSRNRTSLKDVTFTFSTRLDKTSGLEQSLLPSHTAEETTTLASAILELADDLGIDKCIKICRFLGEKKEIRNITDFLQAHDQDELGDDLKDYLGEHELQVLRDKLFDCVGENGDRSSKLASKTKANGLAVVYDGSLTVTEGSKKFTFAGTESLTKIAAATNADVTAAGGGAFLNGKLINGCSVDAAARTGSFTNSSNIKTGTYEVKSRIHRPDPIQFGAVGDTCCKIPLQKIKFAWSQSPEVLGLHKKEIEFAIEHLHRLHTFTLDSSNWQEFRDAWYLVEDFAETSMNKTLRDALKEILEPAPKNSSVLGHTWETPITVLDRIETLSMCFSRSGPPAGVSNALKSVGRELKSKKYLGWVKVLNEEIENIQAIVETKAMVWSLLGQIFLSFLIGVATFASNLAYDEFRALVDNSAGINASFVGKIIG